MPIMVKVLSDDETRERFARKSGSGKPNEDVSDYVAVLTAQKVSIGKAFELTIDTDGKTLKGSKDENDPDGVTVRQAKRRFNAAATQLGYRLRWKAENGMLVARAVSLEVRKRKPRAPKTDGATATPEASAAKAA